MHNGILDAVHDGLVDLCILADQGEAYILAQLLLHVADDPVHLLEHAGDGHHPQGHGKILQIVGQLAELTGRFHKVVIAVPVELIELRTGSNHGFRDDDLAHDIHQVI